MSRCCNLFVNSECLQLYKQLAENVNLDSIYLHHLKYPKLVIEQFLRVQQEVSGWILEDSFVKKISEQLVNRLNFDGFVVLCQLIALFFKASETQQEIFVQVGLGILLPLVQSLGCKIDPVLIKKACFIPTYYSTASEKSKWRELDSIVKQRENILFAEAEQVTNQKVGDEVYKGPALVPKKYAIDTKAAKEYLEGFCPNSPQKDFAQKVIEATKQQSFTTSDFNNLFKDLTDRLREELKGQQWMPVHLEVNKSSLWMLQKALTLNPSLRATMIWNPQKSPIELVKNKTPNLVIFDDAIYSGGQIAQYIGNNIDWIVYSGAQNLYIVVPLVSSIGLSRLKDIAKKYASKLNITILWSRMLKTLLDYYPDLKVSDQKFLSKPPYWNYNRIPVFLTHKVADYASSFPSIYSGIIPQLTAKEIRAGEPECAQRNKPQLRPFIKECIDLTKAYYKTHKLPEGYVVDDASIICPRAPYKNYSEYY